MAKRAAKKATKKKPPAKPAKKAAKRAAKKPAKKSAKPIVKKAAPKKAAKRVSQKPRDEQPLTPASLHWALATLVHRERAKQPITPEFPMRVTLLGTGTAVPVPHRRPTSTLIETATTRVLLDCGSDTIRQLSYTGLLPDDIDAVFLTHHHIDHSAGIDALLFSALYPPTKRSRALVIYGGPGTVQFWERAQARWNNWVRPKAGVEIRELQPGESGTYRDLAFSVAPVVHNRESIAWRVSSPSGRTWVQPGDTGWTDTFLELARGADCMLLEAAQPPGRVFRMHLTGEEAGKIAALAGVKELILTHFYPITDTSLTADEAKRVFSGKIAMGEDFLVRRL
jgi:ribonuclease BN (tRNA processing enzyme)